VSDNEIYKVGFTQGTFDLFHRGHLNLLEQAKKRCKYLIVGVNSDQLVEQYKGNKPIIPDQDRAAIVAALKVVDQVVITETLDKLDALDKYHFNAIFIGDDWATSPRWRKTGQELAERGVPLVYLHYTQGVSTTILRTKLVAQDAKGNT